MRNACIWIDRGIWTHAQAKERESAKKGKMHLQLQYAGRLGSQHTRRSLRWEVSGFLYVSHGAIIEVCGLLEVPINHMVRMHVPTSIHDMTKSLLIETVSRWLSVSCP